MSLHRWHILAAFGTAILLVFVGVTRLSVTALELDRSEAVARLRAEEEENVRLALWRMDSALAGLVAGEGARPYFHYRALYAPQHSYDAMLEAPVTGDSAEVSPLLAASPEHVLLHFHFGDSGQEASSPGISPAGLEDHRFSVMPPDRRSTQVVRLKDFNARFSRESIAERLALAGRRTRSDDREMESSVDLKRVRSTEETRGRAVATLDEEPVSQAPPSIEAQAGGVSSSRSRASVGSGSSRSAFELVKRRASLALQSKAMNQVVGNLAQGERAISPLASATGEAMTPVVMTPIWMDGTLLLARRVVVGGHDYVQGCVLDWEGMRGWLLREVEDLVPGGDLVPSAGSGALGSERRLASLPVSLVPAPADMGRVEASSSVVAIMVLAWAAVVVASLAFGALLYGVAALSERRAEFVSAVTHELRTPLTTFRLYTEMLSDGMVKTEEKRAEYLATLRREAVRLGRLVENVLSYARIERGRACAAAVELPLEDVVASFLERLRGRAEQAGMAVDFERGSASTVARLDVGAVEQILDNLVDNACKYAGTSEEPRVALKVGTEAGRFAVLRVHDNGPGVPTDVRRRLFSPFSKSAQRAAASAPGVGLGLALSRRLARRMAGDLRLEKGGESGACFVLRLPLLRRGPSQKAEDLERRDSKP